MLERWDYGTLVGKHLSVLFLLRNGRYGIWRWWANQLLVPEHDKEYSLLSEDTCSEVQSGFRRCNFCFHIMQWELIWTYQS